MHFLKKIIPLLLICAFSLFFLLNYIRHVSLLYLDFSDGAKYADVARNIISGRGAVSSFNFFDLKIAEEMSSGDYAKIGGIPLAIPYVYSMFFRIFGTNDLSVITASSLFFILTLVTLFLLGKKISGNLTGILTAIALAVNINYLDYATSGASETLFSFEIVLAFYLILGKRRMTDLMGFFVLALMYFTRPQAFIFIGGFILLWLILNFGYKKAFLGSLFAVVVIYLVDRYILYPLSFRYPISPILVRGLQALFTYGNSATSDALRGGSVVNLTISDVGKKVFYNLYNFYRLLPQIAPPYLWGLFFIGLFEGNKNETSKGVRVVILFMVTSSFFLAALTIPFYRYLHPVIPLVYLVAIETLVSIVNRMSTYKYLIFKEFPKIKVKITQRSIVTITSFLLVIFFTVGQTLGVVFLDSRYENKLVNKNQPPAYVTLARILKANTKQSDFILTNLDTWGSWYGERRTMWYPLTPDMVIPHNGEEAYFDAIFLTSYLIDDQNYYMSDEWRRVFYSPDDPGNEYIRNRYMLAGEYVIPADETYSNHEERAVLLLRNTKN